MKLFKSTAIALLSCFIVVPITVLSHELLISENYNTEVFVSEHDHTSITGKTASQVCNDQLEESVEITNLICDSFDKDINRYIEVGFGKYPIEELGKITINPYELSITKIRY